jgi:hypothetical protein
MPVQQKNAIMILDRMVERARDEEDRTFMKRYGNSTLMITITDDNVVQYSWGINLVDRHVALNVVQSFEEASRD